MPVWSGPCTCVERPLYLCGAALQGRHTERDPHVDDARMRQGDGKVEVVVGLAQQPRQAEPEPDRDPLLAAEQPVVADLEADARENLPVRRDDRIGWIRPGISGAGGRRVVILGDFDPEPARTGSQIEAFQRLTLRIEPRQQLHVRILHPGVVRRLDAERGRGRDLPLVLHVEPLEHQPERVQRQRLVGGIGRRGGSGLRKRRSGAHQSDDDEGGCVAHNLPFTG